MPNQDRQIENWIVESRVCDDLAVIADTLGLDLGLDQTVAFLKARAAELRHVAYNAILDEQHRVSWGRAK